MEELGQAQHRVREQHELEEELQVVREFNAGGMEHLGMGEQSIESPSS